MTALCILFAAVLVALAFTVRAVRLSLHRALDRAYAAGVQKGRALTNAFDRFMGVTAEREVKDVTLSRPLPITVRIQAVTEGELSFLRRTPGGVTNLELVSLAIVEPKMSVGEIRKVLTKPEIDAIAAEVLDFSGFSDTKVAD